MPVYINNEQNLFEVDEEKILQNMEKILKLKGCSLDVSIALVDNQRIQELHREFMDLDSPTDVLSFPLFDEDDEDDCLGEVVASVEMAMEEARERGLDGEAEVMLYLIHGFLHLLGYDDKEEEKAEDMHKEEDRLLGLLGYSAG